MGMGLTTSVRDVRLPLVTVASVLAMLVVIGGTSTVLTQG